MPELESEIICTEMYHRYFFCIPLFTKRGFRLQIFDFLSQLAILYGQWEFLHWKVKGSIFILQTVKGHKERELFLTKVYVKGKLPLIHFEGIWIWLGDWKMLY